MKIKLLKSIPGFQKGEVVESVCDLLRELLVPRGSTHQYRVSELISEGYAEEVKDEIDIELIRGEEDVRYFSLAGADIKPSEAEFMTAFRVVSRVIKELNGDWEADWNESQDKYYPYYNHGRKTFDWHTFNSSQESIIPACANIEVVEKLIKICEPELKLLFGIK